MVRETKVIVPGGLNEEKKLNSVGMFSLATKTWISLQTMKEYRSEASSVVFTTIKLLSLEVLVRLWKNYH